MFEPVKLQSYQFRGHKLEIFVPDANQIQVEYEQKKNGGMDSPYWSQIWPAAIALSEFIFENSHYVKDKVVLELGAGLGLPSFAAAKWAKDICCSDYHADAVALITKTIAYHQLQNMQAEQLHWQSLPDNINADTLLLSDVNYNPKAFDTLYAAIQNFLNTGTCVVLSTPQRLLSKPFVEKLLPWCVRQEEREVKIAKQTTNICIMVLKTETNSLKPLNQIII